MRHGADQVIAQACKNTVPSVRALEAILSDGERHEKWQEYVADMTWLIAKRLNKNLRAPAYSDISRRGVNRVDSRSKEEIVQNIIARRRKKRSNRGDKQ